MGRVSKFVGLTRYFEQLQAERVDLTFEQIEHQIGEKLCASAYRHEAYWHLSDTHIMPRSWTENNYRMINLSLKKRTVSFEKDFSAEKQNMNKVYPMDVVRQKSENNKSILEAAYLVENIEKFYAELKGDINSRYLSWEHCYSTFGKYKDKIDLSEDDIDFLALHLATYLSSWGMYRGSSFLLQKDYKVHSDVVKELMKKEYRKLWAMTCDGLQEESNLDLLFLLSERIKGIYIQKRKNVKERDDVSSILITKILMGTMGCVPAYDRFLVQALREYKVASGNYNKASVCALANYYRMNKEWLEQCREKLVLEGEIYPQMKVLDMGLWKIGFELGDTEE